MTCPEPGITAWAKSLTGGGVCDPRDPGLNVKKNGAGQADRSEHIR